LGTANVAAIRNGIRVAATDGALGNVAAGVIDGQSGTLSEVDGSVTIDDVELTYSNEWYTG
jgi:hypothetical protein